MIISVFISNRKRSFKRKPGISRYLAKARGAESLVRRVPPPTRRTYRFSLKKVRTFFRRADQQALNHAARRDRDKRIIYLELSNA